MPFRFIIYSIITVLTVSCTSAQAALKIVITVNSKPFNSVSEAADAEKQVDFWDANMQDETACTESYAAVELKKFLILAANLQDKDITFSTTTELPSANYLFLLGTRQSNPLIDKYDKDAVELETPQSFRIKTLKNNNTTICIIEGKSRIGTLYGVYEYLDRLGVQFIGLGETGTVLPTEKAELLTDISIVENPAFLTRGYCTKERNNAEDKFFIWMGRNRMNLWAAAQENKLHLLKKLGIQLADGFHDIQGDYINPHHEYPYNHSEFTRDENKPDDPYTLSGTYKGDADSNGILTNYEAHPEWYGFHNGKRSDKKMVNYGDNYCTSNKEATEEFTKNFIQSLIDGKMRYADIVYFWTLDAGVWCECDECKKLGNYTDRLLLLTYQVNRTVQQAITEGRLKRPIHINTLAYQETLEPLTKPLPADFDYDHCSVTFFAVRRCYAHPFADPDCTEINEHICQNYQKWVSDDSLYKGSVFVGEYYNISSFKSLPIVFSNIISEDIPWFYEHKARHFHYMHAITDRWGTWTLNEHLLSKILWNPAIEDDSVIDNYFNSYYPTTSETTRQFYQLFEKAMSNVMAWKCGPDVYGTERYVIQHKLKEKQADIFPYHHLKFEQYTPRFNDGVDILEMVHYIEQARDRIDKSLLKCKNKQEKQRLIEDEHRFEYAEKTCRFYCSIIKMTLLNRQGDELNARKEFKQLRKLAKDLSEMKDLTTDSAKDADSPNAFAATLCVDHYNDLREKYGK